MILTFIFIIMTLLGIIIVKSDIGEDSDVTGGIMIVFGSAFLIISLIVIIAAHAFADKNIQRNKRTQMMLHPKY